EVGVLGWPAVPSFMAFEGGLALFASRRPYFPLDAQGQSGVAIERAWYMRILGELSAVLHFPNQTNLLSQIGFEAGGGPGVGLPAFLDDRVRLGPPTAIGEAFFGLRLIDTPYGLFALRFRFIPLERVY